MQCISQELNVGLGKTQTVLQLLNGLVLTLELQNPLAATVTELNDLVDFFVEDLLLFLPALPELLGLELTALKLLLNAEEPLVLRVVPMLLVFELLLKISIGGSDFLVVLFLAVEVGFQLPDSLVLLAHLLLVFGSASNIKFNLLSKLLDSQQLLLKFGRKSSLTLFQTLRFCLFLHKERLYAIHLI